MGDTDLEQMLSARLEEIDPVVYDIIQKGSMSQCPDFEAGIRVEQELKVGNT